MFILRAFLSVFFFFLALTLCGSKRGTVLNAGSLGSVKRAASILTVNGERSRL